MGKAENFLEEPDNQTAANHGIQSQTGNELEIEEIVVEELSIDGICGVY
jgi:mycofactocin precursor